MKKLFLLLYLCVFSVLAFAQSSEFPPKPNRLVNDYADMLSAEEEQALEQKLRNYSDTTSTQIAVVLMTSIGGYDPNQYAAELGERWGVGKGNYDNGLVILVAKEERTVTIQTGYGLEEYVPDALAKRITERTLKPAFSRGQFYEGLDQATSLIIDLASGAYQADPTLEGEGEGGPSLIFIIIIVILVLIIISKMGGGGGRGNRRYARTFGGPVFIPGGFGTFRSGGGVFGGGGGGGFGGFGGGSFGGGGASSSW